VQLEAFATPHVARKQQQFRPAPGFFGNNPAINPPGACKNNYARYLRRKRAMQHSNTATDDDAHLLFTFLDFNCSVMARFSAPFLPTCGLATGGVCVIYRLHGPGIKAIRLQQSRGPQCNYELLIKALNK